MARNKQEYATKVRTGYGPKVTARVSCVLELIVGTYDHDASFKALRERVVRDADKLLSEILEEVDVKVLEGTTKVKFIMVEE